MDLHGIDANSTIRKITLNPVYRTTMRVTASEAACRPATNGTTYLTIGQDIFSIDEYLREQYNASLHEYYRAQKNAEASRTSTMPPPPLKASFVPAAYMVYTDIQTLRGLAQPVDYGSGVEYADGLVAVAAESRNALQIGLWLNGTQGCSDVLSGALNVQIERLYQYVIRDCQATKIFLRVGYEFDNPVFGYGKDPASYRRAFRFLVEACAKQYSRRQCQGKIAFVWHSWAAGTPGNATLDDFYPGDAYVDWIGVSLFTQLYTDSSAPAGLGSRATVAAVLDFAAAHERPAMIAESTPFGGIDCLPDPWMDWFDPVLTLIEDYDIAMWSYINCDWDSQPMWHGVGFGDSRLSTNATVLLLWKQRVLDNPRFSAKLSCSDCKNCGSSAGKKRWSSRRRPFHGEASREGNLPPPFEPPGIYWLGAAVIVAALLGCLFRDAWILSWCRRAGHPYEALRRGDRAAERDDAGGGGAAPVVAAPNRTGYGAVA